MPDIFGMGRFNEENKYGSIVAGIKHAKKHSLPKRGPKGCPKNNYGDHLYVAHKSLHYWNGRKTNTFYHVSCLFCLKPKRKYSAGRDEVLDTRVENWYHDKLGMLQWKTTIEPGDVDLQS